MTVLFLLFLTVQPAEKNPKLVGALDMGGGSVQISFIPEDLSLPNKDDTSYLKLYGVNYTLYTHSYLCYGFREAQRKLMAHIVEVRSLILNFLSGNNISYPLKRTRTCAYQGVRNVMFSDDFVGIKREHWKEKG